MNWLKWSLFSAIFAGLTAILSKLGVGNTDSNLATAVRTSVVLILALAVVASTQGFASLRNIPIAAWIPLTASGLTTGLSWLCYFRALQLGPASRVAPVDKLSVVFVVLLASVFLNEPLTLRTVSGVGLIVAGVFVLAR